MPSLWPWLLRRPRWVLTASLALTGFLAWHLRNLDFDSSPSTLILSGSPEIEYYERMTRVFGSDRVLLIGIRVMDALSPETLQKTRNLTYELERIPGVTRVLSLTNVADVRGGEDEVSIAPLVPEDLGAIDKEALRARLQANPLYEKNLVSRDLRMASLIVFLEEPGQGAALARGREITRSVRAVVTVDFPITEPGERQLRVPRSKLIEVIDVDWAAPPRPGAHPRDRVCRELRSRRGEQAFAHAVLDHLGQEALVVVTLGEDDLRISVAFGVESFGSNVGTCDDVPAEFLQPVAGGEFDDGFGECETHLGISKTKIVIIKSRSTSSL